MEKNSKNKDFIFAVGRRKEAVARVRLFAKGNGELLVNQRPIHEYFGGEVAKTYYQQPLRLTDMLGKCTITVRVEGGGKAGQLDAVVLGVARALDKLNREKFRPLLKKKGLLTRDARVRERRKVGTGGKARRKKQSPKR